MDGDEHLAKADAMHAAIQQVFHDHTDDSILISWVLVAKTMDKDGISGSWTLCPNEQLTPDSLGLLRWGELIEEAGIVSDAVKEALGD